MANLCPRCDQPLADDRMNHPHPENYGLGYWCENCINQLDPERAPGAWVMPGENRERPGRVGAKMPQMVIGNGQRNFNQMCIREAKEVADD